MENLLMLADKQAQKGMVPGYAAKSCIVCTQMEPGARPCQGIASLALRTPLTRPARLAVVLAGAGPAKSCHWGSLIFEQPSVNTFRGSQ